MANFGWSYPAGCRSTPYDEPAGPCDVCGQDVDSDACICPECPECGGCGDSRCYVPGKCGLVRSPEQLQARADAEAAWKAEADAERLAFELDPPETW
ncbi:hypothetical protein AB1L88_15610 [Tautonia sp. JC769]|uniref:hypothetical protein n=1 Tax=Tautonia sp. JC769 TaxID=3232135 RepID=UPI00345A97DC